MSTCSIARFYLPVEVTTDKPTYRYLSAINEGLGDLTLENLTTQDGESLTLPIQNGRYVTCMWPCGAVTSRIPDSKPGVSRVNCVM